MVRAVVEWPVIPLSSPSLVRAGGGGRVVGGKAGGVVRSGSGGPRESKPHSSRSIPIVPASPSAPTHPLLTPTPRGRCRRVALPLTSENSAGSPWRCGCTRKADRTGSSLPESGTAVSGSGCGALPSGRYGCCCCCGTCSRAVRRAPNEHPRVPPPTPLRPHPHTPPTCTRPDTCVRSPSVPDVPTRRSSPALHLRTSIISSRPHRPLPHPPSAPPCARRAQRPFAPFVPAAPTAHVRA